MVEEVYKLSQTNRVYYVVFDNDIVGVDVNFDGSVSEKEYISEGEFDNVFDSLEEVSVGDAPDSVLEEAREFHS
jgi:hypothetical protein